MTSGTRTACGGSNSKSTNGDNTSSIRKDNYSVVDCKKMLPAIKIAQLTAGSSCGFLTVPEKYALYGQPESKKKIEIAIVKLAAKSANKKSDPVVYLQGGPGGAATASIREVITGVLIKDRDVYLVDQRGTGFSKPALICTEYQGEAGSPEQLKSCKSRLEKSGIDLDGYRSVHNALDIIALREALEIPQWNIYGISYGTRLATTIMRENSNGIRSVILDGMFPIEVNGITDTPWANYETLNQIVKNCTNYKNCPDNMKVIIEDVVLRMHNNGMFEESRIFIQNMLELAMSPSIISYITAVNKDLSKYDVGIGDDDECQDSDEGREEGDEIFYAAMGLSTICAEEFPFLNKTALINSNDQGWSETTKKTVDGMFHMGFDKASCAVWNVSAANDIEMKPVESSLPVLILNGKNDAQTPAAWGELVAKNMTMVQSFINPQGGHGQLGEHDCFDNIVGKFLLDLDKNIDVSCISKIPVVTYD